MGRHLGREGRARVLSGLRPEVGVAMKSEEDELRILRSRRKTGQALGPRERSVQRLAVRAMAGGRAPTVETLSLELGLPVDSVREALASLEACDCVLMDGNRIR